jgi:hypothetical protein
MNVTSSGSVHSEWLTLHAQLGEFRDVQFSYKKAFKKKSTCHSSFCILQPPLETAILAELHGSVAAHRSDGSVVS